MSNLDNLTTKELASDLIAYMSIILCHDKADKVTQNPQDSAIGQELEKLANNNDYKGIIAQVIKKAPEIIVQSSDNDIEGCFNIAQALLLSLPAATSEKLFNELVAVVLKDTESKQMLRLSIVVNLFNKLDNNDAKSRYFVFTNIVDYAAATKNSNLIFSYMKDFDKLFDNNKNLSLKEVREMYLKIGGIFEKNGFSDEGQNLLYKYLATFQEASKSELAAIKDTAVRVATSAIKSPIYNFTSTKSLLDYNAITQLKEDSKHEKLYTLVKIFCHDKLAAYMAFYKQNPNFFSTYGIDHANCVANMRLLSICSLAAEGERVSYDKIAEALELDVSEVEEWVVKATTAKLIEAQIDQIEKFVLISWSAHRNFGANEWKMLNNKLNAWKTNIRSLLATVRSAKEANQ